MGELYHRWNYSKLEFDLAFIRIELFDLIRVVWIRAMIWFLKRRSMKNDEYEYTRKHSTYIENITYAGKILLPYGL